MKNNLSIWKRIHSYFLNDMDLKKLLINLWFLQKLRELNKNKKSKRKFIKDHLRFVKIKRFIYQAKKNQYKKKLIKWHFSLKQFYAKKSNI